MKQDPEFDKWHDENPSECPVCNPHLCDEWCSCRGDAQ